MKLFKFKPGKKGSAALLCSAVLFSANVHSQSLEQAVAYALDTAPQLRATYTQFKVKEKQVAQAEAGYWPTIDATGGYGYEYTDSPSTRNGGDSKNLNRSELGLRLQQNIFTGFHTSSEVSRTSYATSAEQWRLHSAGEDLALEISQVYIDLIKTEKLINLSEKNLASHQEIYNQIKERTDSGFGSSADLSQVGGRLAKAQSNLIAAKNNYLDSKAVFYRVIDQRPEKLVIPVPDAALLPQSEEEGVKIALANHPVLKSAQNDINSAAAQHDSANSTYYPKITLDIEANYNNNIDGADGQINNVGGDNNEVIAMVRFSYNIFSGGKDQAYAKETAYKMSEAKELNRNAHREVEQEFILSWNAFEQLNLQKKYIKMHVIASKDTQSDYGQQFKIGQRTLLDLLDTENELYQARRDFLDAEFSEISAQYRIFHSMGSLLNALRITRPSSWQGEQQFDGGVSL
ncbi:channel protein TolC [Psychromonas sp. MB-3u-54]|uniref:TolC family outer membrane protein n=1 Tax=Psychromonas sp. MB-3u-54 TaxID=2058319 RepID=UPI000C34DF29|nr:TolC family outer membrane protein [Psychromonas sp. MB-3u-54]PKH03949.1 channel protein TolC [Psychromonas sp. MB-3u-54]